MQCPKCQFDNRKGVKFCEDCGAKFEIECPACRADIPFGRNFCGECGHQLIPISEDLPIDFTQPRSYTPKHLAEKILTNRSAIEGERKFVTVLFADVANYTSMAEKLDPEEVHEIMDGCFKILMVEIHRYEGTINQFTGDGVMALFGAPVAHEDHAQRSCYAALAIQEAMEHYSTNLKKAYGVHFSMRIGLNCGTVIVGAIGDDLRMDYTAIGDTTNLAARMESHAQPGTVLGTSKIYKLTKDFFQFESIGKVPIKGKEEAVETFRLLKAAEIVTRIEAAKVKGLTKFVGRSGETLSLKKAFEKARSGSGQVVEVVGEAGVGKSRLLIELVKMLPKDDYIFLEGKCLHYGQSIPYLPILDILRGYFGIKERDLETIVERKIEEKIAHLGEDLKGAFIPMHYLFSLKIEDQSYHKLEPKQKRKKIFEPIRNLFVRESKNRPLVIAVEDLHWIDQSSEEFLDYLAGALGNARILLILVYRPEYSCQWESDSSCIKIGLNQLQRESSTEMVNAILCDSKVVPELEEFIIGKAGGNPLFIEELIKSLFESGLIQKEDYQYIVRKEVSQFTVPDTIQGIIASRIDRLVESTKQILQVASVIGREFSLRILQATMEIKADFKSHLRELERLEFITKGRLLPELEYTFKHALIQEVAYSSLLHKRRKKIHEKTGKAVESLYMDNIEKYYEFLAYQYGRSANTDKAIEYLSLANEKVAKASAMNEAFLYFEKAMNLLETQDATEINRRRRISLLIKQYYVFMRILKLPEYYDLLTRYKPMAIELNDQALLGTYYALLGRCEYNNGHFDQAIVTVRKAIELCQASGNFESAAFSYLTLQLSHMYMGNYEEVIKLKEEILRVMQERLNDRWYALESCSVSWAFSHLGRWDEAIEEGQKALGFAQGITDKSLVTFVNFVLSYAYIWKGVPRLAIKYGQIAVDRAPTPSDKTWAQGILSWAWCRAGNPKKGVDELAAILPISRARSFMPTEIIHTIMIAEGYWQLREFKKANTTLKQGIDLAERCGMKFYLGWAHRLLGEIALETDLANAAAHFEQGIGFFKEIKAQNELALTYAGYGRLHRRKGDIPKAREYLTEALKILEHLGTLIEPDKVRKELEQLTED